MESDQDIERESERRRVRTWKTEKARLKRLIQKKKRECWQRYAEEQSWDDVWKLIKFAKDPWRTKETMKSLVDDNNTPCNTEDNCYGLTERKVEGAGTEYIRTTFLEQ